MDNKKAIKAVREQIILIYPERYTMLALEILDIFRVGNIDIRNVVWVDGVMNYYKEKIDIKNRLYACGLILNTMDMIGLRTYENAKEAVTAFWQLRAFNDNMTLYTDYWFNSEESLDEYKRKYRLNGYTSKRRCKSVERIIGISKQILDREEII